MTRGRKKDLSIPATRALVQQRDYRARKAHYVAELEERCRKAEEENVQLRRELELARANMTLPCHYNPLATELSADLQHSLSLASASLAKFQDFVRQNPPTAGPSVQLPSLQECLRTAASLPPILSHTQIPPIHIPAPLPRSPPSPRGRKRLCRDDSPSSPSGDLVRTFRTYQQEQGPRLSSSPESECCGPYFDCDGLSDHERESQRTDLSQTPPSLDSNERTTSRFTPRRSLSR